MNLPNALVFFFLTILSAFFIAKDKPRYKAFFRNSLPLRVTRVSKRLYSTTLKALLGYIKAQGILMVISFVMFLLSFHVMGFSYAILLAAIIAFMDALPAIGAGVFLIPWGLIAALTGSYPTAIGLGIIYLLQALMRQSLEPRIVGQQIGINPVITMLSMYVGLKLFGIFGLVYAPFFVIMLKSVATIYLDGQTYREKVDGITPHDGFLKINKTPAEALLLAGILFRPLRVGGGAAGNVVSLHRRGPIGVVLGHLRALGAFGWIHLGAGILVHRPSVRNGVGRQTRRGQRRCYRRGIGGWSGGVLTATSTTRADINNRVAMIQHVFSRWHTSLLE